MKEQLTIREKFKKKKTLYGTFVKIPSPAIIEMIGLAGFDFVIIDCEHGPLDMITAENMIRAANIHNLSSIIRVSENNAVQISRALDIGADAIQVPQVGTKADAKDVVKAAKFFPEGERGICRYVRSANYSSKEKSKYFNEANKETQVIIQIEGKEGIENFDEILQVENIDILFIGPYDLSQSLGMPGEVENPEVVKRMEQLINKAHECGKVIGTFVDDVESAKKWESLGVQYIAYAVDTGIIFDAFKSANDKLNNL